MIHKFLVQIDSEKIHHSLTPARLTCGILNSVTANLPGFPLDGAVTVIHDERELEICDCDPRLQDHAPDCHGPHIDIFHNRAAYRQWLRDHAHRADVAELDRREPLPASLAGWTADPTAKEIRP